MKKILLILFVSLMITSCSYDIDYQIEIAKQIPNAKIYKLNHVANRYIVVSKDSSVYYVECSTAFGPEISSKQLLFSFAKH